MTNADDLVARLRKSFKSLDGVVVVSPKLLADAAKAIENNTYNSRRDRSLERRVQESGLALEAARQENERLLGIVKAATEANDMPLWRRIASQRIALRWEMRMNRIYTDSNRDLRRQVEALKAELATSKRNEGGSGS